MLHTDVTCVIFPFSHVYVKIFHTKLYICEICVTYKVISVKWNDCKLAWFFYRVIFIFVGIFQRFKESVRHIQGALIFASFFQIILGFFGFIRIFARYIIYGWKLKPFWWCQKLKNYCLIFELIKDHIYDWCRFLSPLGAVPLVTLTGLGLFAFGFPQVTMLMSCVFKLRSLLIYGIIFFIFATE